MKCVNCFIVEKILITISVTMSLSAPIIHRFAWKTGLLLGSINLGPASH